MAESRNRPEDRKSWYLSRDELAEFHTRGFIGPFTLYEPDEMKAHWRRLRLDLFDRRHAAYQDVKPGSGVYDYDRHLDNAFLADLVCRPQIVHRMASILGPDVICWRSEFFPKYPGDEGTDWHQADTFGGGNGIPHIVWPDGSDFGGALTIWMAFTEASEETACMQFIPGTQRTMYYDESKGMHYDPARVNRKEVNGVLRGFFGYDWREIQVDPNWEPDEVEGSLGAVPRRAVHRLLVDPYARLAAASGQDQGNASGFCRALCSDFRHRLRRYEGHQHRDRVGRQFSLEKYGSVLVAGRDDFGHNRMRTHTTQGQPYTNVAPR